MFAMIFSSLTRQLLKKEKLTKIQQVILLVKRDIGISIKIVFFLLLEKLLFISCRLILCDNPFKKEDTKKIEGKI